MGVAPFSTARYPRRMKNFLIAIIVIAILGAGGYYAYMTYVAPVTTQNITQEPTNENGEITEQVQIQDVTVGEGDEAVPGVIVSVLYVGMFEDGTVFDSSEQHVDPETGEVLPLTFILGAPDLIPGFQIGINGMRAGGERVMAVPASLAYGAQAIQDTEGNVLIPANSNLVFNVQLLSVEPAEAAEVETETTTEE